MEVGISLEKAKVLVSENIFTLSSESINLSDANGRILSKSLISKVNDPRFDNSAMDGWAVIKEDCNLNGETKLIIKGEIQAGTKNPPSIKSGEACKITTGAPIPDGANAIVIREDSRVEGNNVIIIGPARKSYIRIKGENLSLGTKAILEEHKCLHQQFL